VERSAWSKESEMAPMKALSGSSVVSNVRRAGANRRNSAVTARAGAGVNGHGASTPFDNVSFQPVRESDIARAMSSRYASVDPYPS